MRDKFYIKSILLRPGVLEKIHQAVGGIRIKPPLQIILDKEGEVCYNGNMAKTFGVEWVVNPEAEKVNIENDLGHLCKNYLGYGDWDKVHEELSVWIRENLPFKAQGRQYFLIMLPRGHLKSCVVTKGLSIQLMLRNPNIRILIANAIWDNARGFLKTIMAYLGEGSKLEKIYGTFFPKHKTKSGLSWTPDAITISQRTIPQDAATITSTGVERTQTSQHYDVIILDDVVVRENIGTKDQRDKVINFYRDCIDLLEPNGILIVVGTTWHYDDLYSAIPQNDEDFTGLLHNPDYKIFKRVAEQGTPESVIFPKKFSFEELMKIKKSKGIFSYSSQYLLNPYPEEDQTFRKTWIRFWKYPEEQKAAEKVIPKELYVSMILDSSLGKAKSDWSGLVSVGTDVLHDHYVLEAKRFRRKVEFIPEEIIKSIRALKSRGYDVNIIGLEFFGFQQSLLEPIQKGLRAAGITVSIEGLPYENQMSKEDRILGLVPAFSDHTIYIHESMKDLMDEMLHFNPISKHNTDDLLDATAWSKVYWSRVPRKIENKDVPYGSLQWWLNQTGKKDVDIFSEFRH